MAMRWVAGTRSGKFPFTGNKVSARLGILAILLISVMGLMGMGYGLWGEVLTAEGTASAGSVAAAWSSASGRSPFTDDDGSFDHIDWDDGENGSPNQVPKVYDGHGTASSAGPSSPDPNASRYDKDVSVCTVTQQADLDGRDTALNASADNVYASYWCTTHAYTKNTGSIPLKLQDILLHDAVVISRGNTSDLSIRQGEVWCYDADLLTSAVKVADENAPRPNVDGDPEVPSPRTTTCRSLSSHRTTASSGTRWIRLRAPPTTLSARWHSMSRAVLKRQTTTTLRSSSSGYSGMSSCRRRRRAVIERTPPSDPVLHHFRE